MVSEERLAYSRRIGAELGPLFDGARLPMIVLRADGAFVAANRAAVEQYGYPLEEILGLKIQDLIVGEHDVARDFDLIERGLYELSRRLHRRKDGSHFWVMPAASPMVLLGERHIVSVPQDVTAVVEAETRADEDERRADAYWNAASEQLHDGIALIDADFRVIKVNSAMRTLLQKGDDAILGHLCRDVFPVCHESPCPHQLAAAENRSVVREFQGRVSGRPLRVEVSPFAPPGDAGGLFAFVHVGHDQTEERAFRSELISADRLATIGRLAAGVAHEVNNPAALVTVNLGVLRDRIAAGTARSADAITILDESLEGMRRIHDMVRDLKGFARERAKERVDLGEIVSSAIRMAAHATRGHARVHKELERDVFATVRGARIAQVVLNLLINAAEAIAPGRPSENSIAIRIWKDRGKAFIEVADTGPGVPSEIATRIFEPFFTTREEKGGTGLGLWLAREIIEEEGGQLVLCENAGSVSPSEHKRRGAARGARFRISLNAATSTPTSFEETPRGDRPKSSPPSVLG